MKKRIEQYKIYSKMILKNNPLKIILLMAVAVIIGCHPVQKKEDAPSAQTTSDSFYANTTNAEKKVSLTFIDSIISKSELSNEQIKKHTRIDSVYITQNSNFSGDTVYYPNKPHPIVMIDYNDGVVCLYKFLLVCKSESLENVDYKIVYTDCDEDISSDYRKLSFQILNDTAFLIKELLYKRLADKSTDTINSIQHYIINKSGKIQIKEEREQ